MTKTTQSLRIRTIVTFAICAFLIGFQSRMEILWARLVISGVAGVLLALGFSYFAEFVRRSPRR